MRTYLELADISERENVQRMLPCRWASEEVLLFIQVLLICVLYSVWPIKVDIRSHGKLSAALYQKYAAVKLQFESVKTVLIVLPEETVFVNSSTVAPSHVILESFEDDHLQNSKKAVCL